jgi:hypothetical protein
MITCHYLLFIQGVRFLEAYVSMVCTLVQYLRVCSRIVDSDPVLIRLFRLDTSGSQKSIWDLEGRKCQTSGKLCLVMRHIHTSRESLRFSAANKC